MEDACDSVFGEMKRPLYIVSKGCYDVSCGSFGHKLKLKRPQQTVGFRLNGTTFSTSVSRMDVLAKRNLTECRISNLRLMCDGYFPPFICRDKFSKWLVPQLIC